MTTRMLFLGMVLPAATTLLALAAALPSATTQTPRPEILIPSHHHGGVSATAVARNGRWLVTAGGEDKTLRIWSLPRLEFLGVVNLQASAVALALDQSGRRAAVGLDNGNIQMIDLAKRAVVGNALRNVSIVGIAWSSDDSLISVLGESLMVIDAVAWRQIWSLSIKQPAHFDFLANRPGSCRVAFAPDSAVLFTAGPSDTAKAWDAHTGAGLFSMTGHTAPVTCVQVDKATRRIFTSGFDGSVRIWDGTNGQPLTTPYLRKGRIKEFRLLGPHASVLLHWENHDTSIAMMAELTQLAPAEDEGLQVVSSETGKVLASRDILSGGFNLTPDESMVVLAYDWPELLSVSALEEAGRNSNSIATLFPYFTSKGLWAFPSEGYSMVRITPEQVSIIPVLYQPVLYHSLLVGDGAEAIGVASAYASGPDGMPKSNVFTTDLATFSLRKQIERRGVLENLTANDSGTTLAWTEEDKSNFLAATLNYSTKRPFRVVVWDTKLERERRVLTSGDVLEPQAHLGPLVLDRDGNTIAIAHTLRSINSKIRVLIAENRSNGSSFDILLPTDQGDTVDLTALCFLEKRNELLVSDSTGNIYTIDLVKQKLIRTFKASRHSITEMRASLDGNFVFGADDKSIFRLKPGPDGGVEQFLLTSEPAKHLSLSPDGRLLAFGVPTGGLQIWDLATITLKASFFAELRDNAPSLWLTMEPNGNFESSGDFWSVIRWRFNADTFNSAPVGAFLRQAYFSGLTKLALNGGAALPPAPKINVIALSQSDVSISRDATWKPTQRNITLNIAVKGNVQDLRLFRNGILLRKWPGILPVQKAYESRLSITEKVITGENTFRAYAFNKDQTMSTLGELRVEGSPELERAPVLHVVAVGIDSYRDSRMNLKYAGADAKLLASELDTVQRRNRTYGSVDVSVLQDEDATKTNILQAMQRVTEKAEPEDDVILFFAGHGAAAGKRFFFLCHETDFAAVRGGKAAIPGALSDLDLEKALSPLDASRIMVVVDACQSGEILGTDSGSTPGPLNGTGFAQVAYEKGAQVLAASQSFQSASESTSFGHGLLTWVFVKEGLADLRADCEPKDGYLTWDEWISYALHRVLEIQIAGDQRAAISIKGAGWASQKPSALIRQESPSWSAAWGSAWDRLKTTRAPQLPSVVVKTAHRDSLKLVLATEDYSIIKSFSKLVQANNAQGFVLVAADQQDIPGSWKGEFQQLTIIADPANTARKELGACDPDLCLDPSIFIFDSKGALLYRGWGFPNWKMLQKIVEPLNPPIALGR